MELIYVAAAIMMGLGGMGARLAWAYWVANSLRARHVNPSWRQSYRARSF